MLVKQPKNPRRVFPPPGTVQRHRVKTGDNWWSVGKIYGFSDPWDMIGFNYNTRDPEEVNWYLQELVGCTRSSDGKNYSFDSSDRFGIIYIPQPGFKFTKPVPQDNDRERILSYAVDALKHCQAPFVQPSMLDKIARQHVFCVGDPNLPVMAEYDYVNILYCRKPQDLSRPGTVDHYWLLKEVCHLAYGAHGLKQPFTARTEAVALLGAYACKRSYDRLHEKGSKLPFSPLLTVGHATRQAILAALQAFWQSGGGNAGLAGLSAVEREVAKEPLLLRRRQGHWRPMAA